MSASHPGALRVEHRLVQQPDRTPLADDLDLERTVDEVVGDTRFGPSGVSTMWWSTAAALDDLYLALKPSSSNRGAVDYGALMEGRRQTLFRNVDGAFQLFRIGDAVASRNIHAAVQ